MALRSSIIGCCIVVSLHLLFFTSTLTALPQISFSPLVPGSILPPVLTDVLDNGFSAPPAAGLGTPLVQTNNPRPQTGGASVPLPPPPSLLPPTNVAPILPGTGAGALPAPTAPISPSVPNPVLDTLPRNTTLPVGTLPTLPANGNTTLPSRNVTLERLAPGVIHTNASQAAKSTSSAPDSGLGGLVTAGIVVASVVLASMIGIFLFRKWKLRPKERGGRWRPNSNAGWPTAPVSSLPLHHAMQQHHGYYNSGDGSMGRASPPVPAQHMPSHGSGSAAEYNPPAENIWQPPVHARNVEMDMALRHHLRNG